MKKKINWKAFYKDPKAKTPLTRYISIYCTEWHTNYPDPGLMKMVLYIMQRPDVATEAEVKRAIRNLLALLQEDKRVKKYNVFGNYNWDYGIKRDKVFECGAEVSVLMDKI